MENFDMKEKLKKAMLKREKSFEVEVIGNSMEPFILEGEKVEVKKSKIYKVGELVVFINIDESFLMHRIIKIEESIVYTKGDNAVAIEKLSIDKIVGKVDYIVINKNKVEIIYSIIDVIIAKLSNKMHLRRVKGKSYNYTMKSFYAKIIRGITFLKRKKTIG